MISVPYKWGMEITTVWKKKSLSTSRMRCVILRKPSPKRGAEAMTNIVQWLKHAGAAGQPPAAYIPDRPHAPLIRRRFRFSGLVQGVGFRYEAQRIASQLDLVGWVRNQRDGSVVVEIEGKSNYIEAFLLAIEAVPRFDITDIQAEELPLSCAETTFRVLY